MHARWEFIIKWLYKRKKRNLDSTVLDTFSMFASSITADDEGNFTDTECCGEVYFLLFRNLKGSRHLIYWFWNVFISLRSNEFIPVLGAEKDVSQQTWGNFSVIMANFHLDKNCHNFPMFVRKTMFVIRNDKVLLWMEFANSCKNNILNM